MHFSVTLCNWYHVAFGIPGVKENAQFLKDIKDSRNIRSRILERTCYRYANFSPVNYTVLLHSICTSKSTYFVWRRSPQAPPLLHCWRRTNSALRAARRVTSVSDDSCLTGRRVRRWVARPAAYRSNPRVSPPCADGEDIALRRRAPDPWKLRPGFDQVHIVHVWRPNAKHCLVGMQRTDSRDTVLL